MVKITIFFGTAARFTFVSFLHFFHLILTIYFFSSITIYIMLNFINQNLFVYFAESKVSTPVLCETILCCVTFIALQYFLLYLSRFFSFVRCTHSTITLPYLKHMSNRYFKFECSYRSAKKRYEGKLKY